MALPNVGGIIQSLEGLKRTKRQRKGECPFCLAAELGHWFSLALGLGLTSLALLVLRPSDLDYNLYQ